MRMVARKVIVIGELANPLLPYLRQCLLHILLHNPRPCSRTGSQCDTNQANLDVPLTSRSNSACVVQTQPNGRVLPVIQALPLKFDVHKQATMLAATDDDEG